jgi:hypothetical protein
MEDGLNPHRPLAICFCIGANNLNKGAGLDVSPAVRDYLGLNETDATDSEVCGVVTCHADPGQPTENNTFVINDGKKGEKLAEAPKNSGGIIAR